MWWDTTDETELEEDFLFFETLQVLLLDTTDAADEECRVDDSYGERHDDVAEGTELILLDRGTVFSPIRSSLTQMDFDADDLREDVDRCDRVDDTLWDDFRWIETDEEEAVDAFPSILSRPSCNDSPPLDEMDLRDIDLFDCTDDNEAPEERDFDDRSDRTDATDALPTMF